MKFQTATSPHTAHTNSMTQVMSLVLLGLVPGTIALWWHFGWGVIVNIVIACITAVAAETIVLKLRNRPIQPAIMDLSAIVTAVLLAIALPPLLPWWNTVLGVLFAIVIAKQLFGGVGYNPFNPAMAGYVLLLISFPVSMTNWLPANELSSVSFGLGETVSAIFGGPLPGNVAWDALSGATPLDYLRTQLDQSMMVGEVLIGNMWASFGGKGWESVNFWFLIGGLFLLWRKVINWRIPVSMLASLFLFSGFFHVVDPDLYASPGFHLFSGATMLAAFFIATDPVSASTTPRGQLIFGASIGFIIFVIRAWGGYPDAVAFAVLLLNMAAPTIDYYTKPRVFGVAAKGDNNE